MPVVPEIIEISGLTDEPLAFPVTCEDPLAQAGIVLAGLEEAGIGVSGLEKLRTVVQVYDAFGRSPGDLVDEYVPPEEVEYIDQFIAAALPEGAEGGVIVGPDFRSGFISDATMVGGAGLEDLARKGLINILEPIS